MTRISIPRAKATVTSPSVVGADAAGAGAAVLGARLKARLGNGEIDEVLRDALFSEDALNHGLVAAGALEGVKEGIVALLRFREELDEGADVVVDDKREIGLGGGKFGLSLGYDGGIGLEGYVAGDIGGSGLVSGDETVALLESLHLESIDAVDDVNELVLELGIGFDGDGAGEEEIDSSVELGFGLSELTLVVGSLAECVGVFDLLDDLADGLLVGGEVRLGRLSRRVSGSG